MRRTSVRASVPAIVGLALLAGACGAGPGAVPRNLILISLDTLRPDHLGCYGYGRDTSPAIDRLAARGVRFADASSSAPWTLPAHTTMFTGLYPSHHGVKDYAPLAAERVTLAEVLAARGFQTFAVANTLNIANPSFALFQGFAPEHLRYIRETSGEGAAQVILNSGREVAAAAQEFLAGRDADRPFFLFAHFYDAHTDFTAARRYRERFVSPYAGSLQGSTVELLQLRARGVQLSAEDVRHLRELYDAEIAELDEVLGGFLDYLAREGLEDDTLIALVSDHGEEFFDHGGLLHGRTQYQELLAVPMILAGPGLPRGAVVEEAVSLVDLLPTLLARFGIPLPSPVDGVDLAPTWSGGALAERLLFAEADHNNLVDGKPVVDIKRMARLGHEKLVHDRHTDVMELFHLGDDPREEHDCAGAEPERARFLRAALARFLDGAVQAQAGAALSDEDLELLRKLGYAGEDG